MSGPGLTHLAHLVEQARGQVPVLSRRRPGLFEPRTATTDDMPPAPAAQAMQRPAVLPVAAPAATERSPSAPWSQPLLPTLPHPTAHAAADRVSPAAAAPADVAPPEPAPLRRDRVHETVVVAATQRLPASLLPQASAAASHARLHTPPGNAPPPRAATTAPLAAPQQAQATPSAPAAERTVATAATAASLPLPPQLRAPLRDARMPVATPRATDAARQAPLAALAAAPPPAVQVTIGRVEIRANAAAPTAAPSKPARKPALDLDAYLQQRHGGGR
ncbi:hypothetical protein [Xanthomonas sp. SI]|uniref:hypothetical protein n=1 Tax=Xanthomonas sp. SI TaxID=2724123 RepID=UPI001639E3B9|nr:hypothetical protein [Xanthomonas sp. SI]